MRDRVFRSVVAWRSRLSNRNSFRHRRPHTFLGQAWVTVPFLLIALLFSAALMALEIGSKDYAWISWVALLPLFAAIRALAPRHAMLCGALWGGCVFLFLGANGQAPIELSFRSFALLTVAPALYSFLGAHVTRAIGFAPLFLGLGWVGLEWAIHPLGLRNGLLLGGQGNSLLMHWGGRFLGYGLVAYLVAYVNAWLLAVLSDAAKRAAPAMGGGTSAAPLGLFYPFQLAIQSLPGIQSCRPRAPPLGLSW